jgi:hypothetical protein
MFIFGIQEFLRAWGRCPANTNILATKIGALHRGFQTQNREFLKNDLTDFHQTSEIYGGNLPT